MRLAAAVTAALGLYLARPSPLLLVQIRWGDLPRMPTRAGLLAGAVAVALAVAATLTLPIAVLVVVSVGFGWVVMGRLDAARRRRVRAAARRDTAELVDVLAAEFRSGVPAQTALAAIVADHPVMVPVAQVAARGGDAVSALVGVAAAPGREALSDVAAAWRVSERVGAPLARTLGRVADAVREDAEALREADAAAAPARATAQLMAVLPLLGIGLGAAMGADPVGVITGTIAGATAVAGGMALAAAGLLWIDRIADGANA